MPNRRPSLRMKLDRRGRRLCSGLMATVEVAMSYHASEP